jgi:hypothetical protein
MGFFSDLGNGIASVVKAPFEAVGSVIKGVGEGVGAILHGSSNAQMPPTQYMQGMAQQCQGQNPQMAMQMLQFQNALLTNMLLCRPHFHPCMCGMGMG